MQTFVGRVVVLHLVGGKVHVGVTDGVVDGNLHHLVVAVEPEEGRERMLESSGAGSER